MTKTATSHLDELFVSFLSTMRAAVTFTTTRERHVVASPFACVNRPTRVRSTTKTTMRTMRIRKKRGLITTVSPRATNDDDDDNVAGDDETTASSPSSSSSSSMSGDDVEISPLDVRILQERIDSLKAREASMEVLKLLVLDATVPSQVLPLTFDGSDPKRRLNAGTFLGEDVELGAKFGMLGQAPSNGQILPNGVVVEVTRLMQKPDGTTLVELTASRRFKIHGQPFEDEERDNAPSGRVIFIDDDAGAGDQTVMAGEGAAASAASPTPQNPTDFDDEAKRLCEELPGLVNEWMDLVISRKRERQPGQLDLIKSHIGPMPSTAQPARLACWVAALINPIPALGVAYEIRPALLCAPTVGHMISIAWQGVKLSIEKLRAGPEL